MADTGASSSANKSGFATAPKLAARKELRCNCRAGVRKCLMTREDSTDGNATYAANQAHYEAKYSALDLAPLVRNAGSLDFFHEAVRCHTSWFTLYHDGFDQRLRNKTVLELGAGDGLNALVMARLGARVTAVEISQSAVNNLSAAARELGLDVSARCGNFLEMDLAAVDFVVGKAFLHHLDHETEDRVLCKVAAVLRPQGEARFCEPAVNSRTLDAVRWLAPMPGRPSSLAKSKFAEWKRLDPHPDRDNSSSHYQEAARKHFQSVRITPVGGIERLRRLAGSRPWGKSFGRMALSFERRFLPEAMHKPFARCQLIVMSSPTR